MKVALSGGTPVTLATSSYPYGIGIDRANVYWAGGSAIHSVPLGGGTASSLTSCWLGAQGLAVNATGVYWTTPAPLAGLGACNTPANTIATVPLDGGTATVLAAGQADPWMIAADGANIYWTNQNSRGTAGSVMQLPLAAGSTAIALASGQNAPTGITVDSTSVYWTSDPASDGAGSVMKVPIGGGTATTLAAGLSYPQGIAVDSTNVYLSGGSSTNGTILKVSVNGGTPVTLASGRAFPEWIAVDATSVYWTEQGPPGLIMRAPK